jgi:hypothetical protein
MEILPESDIMKSYYFGGLKIMGGKPIDAIGRSRL